MKTFNEARFLTVGQVAKTLTVAALTAFSACVQETRSNPQHSDYHLHGWSRIEGPLKEFIPLAAFVSAVPDSALAETLEDDRIAVRLDEFKNTLETEFEILCDLDVHAVWSHVAKAWGISNPHQLRSDVLAAALIAHGFVDWRVIRVAEGVPWSLCRGDVHENINRLVAGPKPQGGTTKKMWTLAKMGWNRELLKSGIGLLRQASWSTICVEHGHVPASKLKWLHPRYSKETLIVRSGQVSLIEERDEREGAAR